MPPVGSTTRIRPDGDEPRPQNAAGNPAGPPPTRTPPQSRSRTAVKETRIRESVAGTYQMIGAGVASGGIATQNGSLVNAGVHIVNTADEAADAWIDLAKQNPKVMQALTRFTETSAFAGLLAIHVGMILPIFASQGMVPDQAAVLATRGKWEPYKAEAASNGNGDHPSA